MEENGKLKESLEKDQLVYRLGIAEGQVNVLNDTINKLQNDCEWYKTHISELESQVLELQKRFFGQMGNTQCNGSGYKRNAAKREKCVLKEKTACTKCGKCEKE